MRLSSLTFGLALVAAASSTSFGQSFRASGLGAHGHAGANIFGPSGLNNAGGSNLGFVGHHRGEAGGGVGFGGIGFGLGGVGCGGYGLGYPFYASPYFAAVPSFPPIFPNAVATNFGNGFGGGGFGGMMLPTPRARSTNPANVPARRANPARAKEYVEVGDRSFRGGNIHRAEERYRLAAKADPTSPLPQVHLAQVSIVRGDYATAADQIRSAITVGHDSAWLVNAPDVQAMFAEPADYARHIAKLESHLQAHPNDRDAWFVLGAEHYFSGRTQASNDAFARLTDRKPDVALAAFLDVAKP